MFFTSVIILLAANIANSYPRGAPERVCQTLFPRHSGAQAQTVKAPYRINVTPNNDSTEFKVSIVSNEGKNFKGFILQARSSSNPNLIVNGEFSAKALTKTIKCQSENDALTHNSAAEKSSISTIWKPKSKISPIRFNATIVRSKLEFWTDIISDEIILSNEYTGCGTSRNCFGLPRGCVNSRNCDLLLTAIFEQNIHVRFELFGKVSVAQWFAMGLSNDNLMGDDSVTECQVNEAGATLIRESWNIVVKESYSNVYVNANETVAQNLQTKSEDGFVKCAWKRDMNTQVKGSSFDLSNIFVLLAYGPFQERCLMVIVWFGLVGSAITLARDSKDVLKKKMVLGKPLWFILHSGIMISSIVFAIISMLSIIVHLRGFRMNSVHPYTGIATNIFMVLQLIGALLRCDPNSAYRWIFNWGHFLGGTIAHTLAIVTTFFATTLSAASLPSTFLYLLVIYVLIHISSHIFSQILTWLVKSNGSWQQSNQEVSISTLSMDVQPEIEKSNESPWKLAFIGFYIFVVLVLSFSMIVAIATIE
ncbi:putative ferric-chelate reductase 1-like protein [Dinothrombium tinctorium]|uniref:Putative ferric-chelate reductase 1-like protein n=1 Tax=Dinothrombium tinctorium TaxID=1965070 RepID=A0A443RK60_9ACAR|nr:putative ferric-chelate reductase 1-like protein [Dinothrombium tinctorium]